jgi:hypothetical protein
LVSTRSGQAWPLRYCLNSPRVIRARNGVRTQSSRRRASLSDPDLLSSASGRFRHRYAKPGAAPLAVVFRRWNTPKKSLQRSNLQSIDATEFFSLTSVWHKRCSR